MNRSDFSHRTFLIPMALCLGVSSAQAFGQTEETPIPAEEKTQTFADAIMSGTVKVDIRGRAEIVDQDNLDTAQAYTVRTRLGYLTEEYEGFQFYVEFEDVRTPDDDLYNDGPGASTAGVGRAVVADPEVTELNEVWAQYSNADMASLKIKGGRQGINLDDQRFVGTVGWRQDNQTFDAITASSSLGVDGLDVMSGYIGRVNRIFGEEADFDDADIFLGNASYKIKDVGKLTGFGYFLDIPDSPANSSDTLGLRLTGSKPVGEAGYTLDYAGSVAFQEDTGDNPNDYSAMYYAIDLGLKVPDYGVFGAGYEVLGSDDGAFAFQTPLATLHKFNGFADVFLVTPADGLEDLYVYYGLPFPKEWGMTGKLAYHYFSGNDSIGMYGQEFDAVVTKKLSANLTLLGKIAVFDGDEPGFADRTKLTVDLTFSF